MRIGDLVLVEVQGVKLFCKVTFGELKKMRKEIAAMPDPEAEGGADAWLDYTLKKIVELVIRVEGLEGEDGAPVTKLTRKIVDELPADFVADIFAGITNSGNRTGGSKAADSTS